MPRPEESHESQRDDEDEDAVGVSAGPAHLPGRGVVDEDGVDHVDDPVGALHVGADDLGFDLLPAHEVVLVCVCDGNQ